MRQAYHDLLNPEVVKTVSGLALISRIIVDGYLNGLNHSRRVGSGMEFSQFRSYQPGDDLRLLDWKMLARSGRYYIKQSEIETNISTKFILDASKSMLHQEGSLTKMGYAKVLIASLAHLSQIQGDAIGLFALNEYHLHTVYPNIQKQHYNKMLLELINIENDGKWPEETTVTNQLHDHTSKELIFFITDLYEYNEELTEFIKQLKTIRNEVVVFHMMGADEMNFNYKGTLTFEDLETGIKVKVDAKDAKKKYLKKLKKKMKVAKNEFLSNGIGYHLYTINDPIAESIQYFLKRRLKLL